MLDELTGPYVAVDWLIERLGTRSFGLTLFVMALVALIPGASTIIGVLIAWPAIQMILGRDVPVLPRIIGRREISVEKMARAIRVVTPRLQWIERFIRPRWTAPFQATKRLTGLIMLLLGLTLISPLPFSHLVPALVIMLLALAYLEDDGIAFVIAFIAALSWLAVTAVTVWGVVEAADWLDPVRRE